ncbi:hypothetical protein TcasGA2_TC008054 [Tribolium castaneum]|uniref:Uncharacterized protein n=1 Tax=Tribolium castaneum TaxID=7070 RepID=D1ZZJ1_TRICA|nr:hypothetical protein TcasGA2_TC008054 [Tribolium castaneum]
MPSDLNQRNAEKTQLTCHFTECNKTTPDFRLRAKKLSQIPASPNRISHSKRIPATLC